MLVMNMFADASFQVYFQVISITMAVHSFHFDSPL